MLTKVQKWETVRDFDLQKAARNKTLAAFFGSRLRCPISDKILERCKWHDKSVLRQCVFDCVCL